MSTLKTIFKPEQYHGTNRAAPFFEGWYYKLVSADETLKYAVIPGVFLGEDGYAFIQVLNGTTGEVDFITFPLEDFSADQNDFIVRIDKNVFQLGQVQLDINRSDLRIEGTLNFSEIKGWPISFLSPGVMGWYAWVPKMECYHGVLSFNHGISGSLQINGNNLDFTDGFGYMEKDWGDAFPEGYVWMQSNHFQQPNVCLTASIAIIPWMGNHFRGFIVGLWLDGDLYRFATYTGAKTEKLVIQEEKIIWHMRDRKYRLEITALRGKTGDLKGPTRRDMGMRVAESLTSELHVKLIDKQGEIVFDGMGLHGGLEAAGDIEKLMRS